MRANLFSAWVTLLMTISAGRVASAQMTDPPVKQVPSSTPNSSVYGVESPQDALGAFKVFKRGQTSMIIEGGQALVATDPRWVEVFAAGTPAEVATLIAAGTYRGSSFHVIPTAEPVLRLTRAERALVRAPSITKKGNTHTFIGFFTEPPSFEVWRLQIQATPQGATFAQTPIHQLLDPKGKLDSTLEALRTADPMPRRAYVRELGELGDSKAIPAIVPSLDASTVEERRIAAIALGKIGAADAVPALLMRLDVESDLRTIRYLIKALGSIPGPEATAALEKLGNHRNKDVRQIAMVVYMERP